MADVLERVETAGVAVAIFDLGPGLAGAYPSLESEKLDHGDLVFTTDFRTVYAALLKDWMGANSAQILGGQFTPLPLIKRA